MAQDGRSAAPGFEGGLNPNDEPHPYADWPPADLLMLPAYPDLKDDDVGPYEALRRLNTTTQERFSIWLNSMVVLFVFFIALRFV